MPGVIDLSKTRERMQQLGLQGLLVCSPENFIYTTGYTPLLLDLYRLAPLALCFLPADENLPPALFVPETDVNAAKKASGIDLIYSFPVWWELYPAGQDPEKSQDFDHFLSENPRALPEQYEVSDITALVAALFKKQALDQARIGIEKEFISASVFSSLSQVCPQVNFVDSSSLFYELRSIKTAQEIEYLEQACWLTEAGILRSSQAIQPGVSIGALKYAFANGVLEAAKQRELLDLLGEMGGQPALGLAGGSDADRIVAGVSTTVKYDMQVSVAHYHSDIGRTYICGQPTREQSCIFRVLLEVHKHLLDAIHPGKKISDVYLAGRDALDRTGLKRISRGHFGHSVGLDAKIEEPPFISRTDNTILQPGMVLAVETPCYIDGIGKYQIEDMILVTDEGFKNFALLPKYWGE